MVTEKAEKPIRKRAPHRDGCLCSGCRVKRGEGVQKTSPATPAATPADIPQEIPVPTVPLRSVRVGKKFILNGQLHQVVQPVEGMVVCYNLVERDTATLAGFTEVIQVK